MHVLARGVRALQSWCGKSAPYAANISLRLVNILNLVRRKDILLQCGSDMSHVMPLPTLGVSSLRLGPPGSPGGPFFLDAPFPEPVRSLPGHPLPVTP